MGEQSKARQWGVLQGRVQRRSPTLTSVATDDFPSRSKRKLETVSAGKRTRQIGTSRNRADGRTSSGIRVRFQNSQQTRDTPQSFLHLLPTPDTPQSVLDWKQAFSGSTTC